MNSILHEIGSFGKKKQAEKIHIFLIWNITHIFPPLETRDVFLKIELSYNFFLSITYTFKMVVVLRIVL